MIRPRTLWSRLPLSLAACPCCNATGGRPLCARCREDSLVSAEPFSTELGGHSLHFAGAYYRRSAEGSLTPLGRALRAFKDCGDRYAGRCLARLFAELCTPLAGACSVVVPVASDPSRLRKRGFSAAAWLARELSRTGRARFTLGALERAAGRPPQRGLDGAARRSNARGAFVLGGAPVRGYSIALVDDVVTTGATLADAARCLVEGGALRVVCLALACADEELVAECRSRTDFAGMPGTATPPR